MTIKSRLLLYCLFLSFSLSITSCSKEEPQPVVPTQTTLTPAQLHVQEILSHMKSKSLNRKNIDWVFVDKQVQTMVKDLRAVSETDAVILFLLAQLKDQHSFYIKTTGQYLKPSSSLNCGLETIITPTLPKNIGYVRVTGFTGSGNEAVAFATNIQNTIRLADNDSIKGWIVDLRNNTGGNMWPMIAGIGPILGEGLAGHFIDYFGVEQSWFYRNGASILDNRILTDVANPYKLKINNPKVAVLTNKAAGSSGEATVIAFRQRPNTKSFGTPTCGVSTSNSAITLSNGATLILTTSIMADRNKIVYGSQVIPDVIEPDNNLVVNKAVEWILQ